MKKLVVMLLLGVFLLTACSTGNDAQKESVQAKQEEKKTEETGGALEVDKGLLTVEVTIPASFFEGEDIDWEVAEAEKNGIQAVKNADGSLTYKVSKAQHKEMMKEMKTNVTGYVDELINDEELASIHDIQYNGSFSEFTIVVDRAAYENSFDAFATLGLAMSGMYYQAFNGVNADKLTVTMHAKDRETGERFSTVVNPDALEGIE